MFVVVLHEIDIYFVISNILWIYLNHLKTKKGLIVESRLYICIQKYI